MEELLRNLSRVALADRTLGDVLGEITGIAARGISGCEAASITLIRDEKPFTAAFEGQMALDADELQYERGHGPCIDAGLGGIVLRVDDMRSEQRWPDYVPRVLQNGVRSSLSVPLPYQGATIGALNNYSSRPRAFASDESVQEALEVADAMAVAVVNATAHARVTELAHHMRAAMESRAVIEQAKGVLMAQRHIGAEGAFEILRGASQRYNRKLRDIAAGVVDSVRGERPG